MSYTTTITKNKRDLVAKQLDEFATFFWAGHNMWEEFGAFIINDKKGSLQLYNGPSFSNTYAKSQFASANSILTGVTFNTQTISFTIAVYWFSIEEYRRLLQILHPYAIEDLSFSFAPNWGYLTKLKTITDSTRHVIGSEDGTPRYYTELKLQFDVQGPACAHALSTYVFEQTSAANANPMTIQVKNNDYGKSPDLSTPIDIRVTLPVTEYRDFATIKCTVQYQTQELILFEAAFNNLNWKEIPLNVEDENNTNNPVVNTPVLTLHYMSEQGLLLLHRGDSGEVLTLHTSANGKRIVKQLFVAPFMIPGKLDFQVDESFITQLKFNFITNNLILDKQPIIEAYARTNII